MMMHIVHHVRIENPKHRISHEHPRKEEDFSDEEDPHPLLACLELLMPAFEVVGMMPIQMRN
jgi:hypothetical protein